MGLLTKEVEIRAFSQAKYYEGLGYEIPRRAVYKADKWHPNPVFRGYKIPIDAIIMVKVEDLPKRSGKRVKCECDCCGKIYDITWNQYLRHNHDGKTYCKNCKGKVLCSGENHPRYNPNLTDEERGRKGKEPETIIFIKKVLARDNYTCQVCGISPVRGLVAHHLNGRNWYIEGRTDEANGICLCERCHKAFHAVYGYGDNTKEQFMEWTNNFELNPQKYNGEIPTVKRIYCIEDDETITERVENYDKMLDCLNDNKSYHKSYKGKHYISYEDYLKMDDEEILKYILDTISLPKHRPVICVNIKLMFEKATQAEKWCGHESIGKCCRHVNGQVHLGRDKNTGEWLSWQYLYEYMIENNLTLQDYRELWNNRYIEGGDA